ncbi:hypothetical protein ES703_72619 [subsurface metagenome]
MTSGCKKKNNTPQPWCQGQDQGRCQGWVQGKGQGRCQGRPSGISQEIVEGGIALAVGGGHGESVGFVSNNSSAGQGNAPLLMSSGTRMVADGGVVASSPDLRQVWGNWLEDLGADLQGWDWFATFTFRELTEKQQRLYPGWTRIGWGYAHKALREWDSALMRRRFGKSQPYFMAMMELQKRGVPHWHILVGNTGDERRMDWVDWWFERFGIARILEYNERLGARYYLGKYLTKEVADIQASPQLRACHRSVVAAFTHDGE